MKLDSGKPTSVQQAEHSVTLLASVPSVMPLQSLMSMFEGGFALQTLEPAVPFALDVLQPACPRSKESNSKCDMDSRYTDNILWGVDG